MDALSDFLASIRVEGSIFSRAEMSAPWGVLTRGATDAIFHVVLSGAGWISVDDAPPVAFRSGDLLVVPQGSKHVLSDAPGTPGRWIMDLPTHVGEDGMPCVTVSGGGPSTSILCGTFRLDDRGRESLLPLLPPLLHLSVAPGGGRTAAWLDATLRLIADEIAGARPGVELMVARLADVLFVQILRRWIEGGAGGAAGWLGALGDPGLARALGAVHRSPAHPWTSTSLAATAGMSRTVFFERFQRAVGESPAGYLLRWRMHVARGALGADLGMAEIAERVGYSSEAAFSRAFKRHVGVAPSAWRRARA